MAETGFPIFPVQNQYVKFNCIYSFIGRYTVDIPVGTIGYILKTDVVKGSAFDEAQAYILYIGIQVNEVFHVIKLNYLDRPDVVSIIPDTPAARVLYGNNP